MRRAADLVLVSASHLALGNTDLALETALEGVTICSRMGAGEFLAGLQVARARALLALGRLDEARDATTAAHRAIDDLGAGVYQSEAQAIDREITRASSRSGTDVGSGEQDPEDHITPATGEAASTREAISESAAVL